MKLSHKLLLAIVVAALLALSISSALTYFYSIFALRASIGERQLETAKQVMDKIDRLLYERFMSIQIVAAEGDVVGILNGTRSEERAVAALRALLINSGPWENLSIVRKNSIIAVSTESGQVGKSALADVNKAESYSEALRGMATYSDAYVNTLTGVTMIFSAPIRDNTKPDKPILGVVMSKLSWPIISEVLRDTKGQMYIFNQQGMIVAPLNKNTLNNVSYSSDPRVNEALLGRSKTMEATGLDNVNQTLLVQIPEQGFLDYKGNGWAAVLEMPMAEIYSAARDSSLKQILYLFPIIFLAVFLMNFLMKKYVIRPLNKFVRTANALAEGNWVAKVKIIGEDEIGSLGRAFNIMSDKLHDSFFKLEDEKIKLEKEKVKLDMVALNIDVGVILLDKNGEPIFYNPAVVKMLELKGDNFILSAFKDKFSKYQAGELLAGCLAGNPSRIKEAESNGKIFSISFTKVGGQTDVGWPTSAEEGFAIWITDITEEKLLERSKSEFVAIASHQLRTPMTITKGNVEMLLKESFGRLNTEQRNILNDVQSANERLIALVNDMLDIIHIEKGVFGFKIERLSLEKVVMPATTELADYAKRHNITMTYHPPQASLPEIFGDAVRLRQVIQNILDNAIKYSRRNELTGEPGRVDVYLRAEGDFVEVSISDNGMGIPAAEQPKIFGRFYRASNAEKFSSGGSGLGLYFSKSMIELLGGKIWFKSDEATGTVFTFILPTVAPVNNKDNI